MVYHSGNELVDPYMLFEKAHMQPGMHIADFGCGRTGHVLFPAAVQIGEHGVVYAVDILKDALEIVAKRAKDDSLVNIHTVWADVECFGKTAIPENTLDLVMIVNTLHNAKDPHAMLKEAGRLLKDKGRLLIVDWSKDGLPIGPKREKMVNFEEILNWAQQHGFVLQESFAVGKYHTGVVFYRQK